MVREAWARNLYSCLGKWWCQLLTGASDEPFDLMHLSDDGVCIVQSHAVMSAAGHTLTA